MIRPGRNLRAFTLIELVVVFLIIAIILSLILPVMQRGIESSRRIQCGNNLKQIVLASHVYMTSHGVFPPGVVNRTGPIRNEPYGQHWSWIVQLLPQLEQWSLGSGFDLAESPYSTFNQAPRRTPFKTMMCPSDTGPKMRWDGIAENNYVGCHHDVEAPIAEDNHGVFFLNSGLRYEGIADGTSTTLFFGEKTRNGFDLGWASGTRATLRNTGSPMNAGDPPGALVDDRPQANGGALRGGPSISVAAKDPYRVGGFGSKHPGGANFAFGDGSVRFLRETIDPTLYRYLGHRDDGEMVDESRY